jgi:hypothetical protein
MIVATAAMHCGSGKHFSARFLEQSLGRYSIIIGVMARLDVQETWLDSQQGHGFYLFFKASWSPLGPTQHPIEWVSGTFSGGKAVGT